MAKNTSQQDQPQQDQPQQDQPQQDQPQQDQPQQNQPQQNQPQKRKPPQRTKNQSLTRRDFLALAATTTAVTLGSGSLLAGCAPGDPFGVLFMMAVQSIQDRSGSISLIAGKRTIIRAFPATNAGNADVSNITGSLSIHSGDSTSGPLLGTVFPLAAPISSRLSTAINPDIASHSLDFEIPLAFITGQDLTVQCDLTGDGGTHASYKSTLNFQTKSSLESLAPVLIQPTGYPGSTPTMTDFHSVLEGAIKRLPVPETHYTLAPPTLWVTNRAMTSADDFMWLSTDLIFHFFNLTGSSFPTGIVPAPAAFPPGPIVTGLFNSFLEGATVAFSIGGPINRITAEATFAHEFSHRYGLGHAAGCLSPSGVDPTLPMSTDMTGMDVPLHTIMPRGTSELMSYCGAPRWPSSTTYNRVFSSVS